MSPVPGDRREFLRQAAAGLAGATLLGCSKSEEGASSAAAPRAEPIPPHTPLTLLGVHAYAERDSVAAGETLRLFVSASEPYRLSICRLGLRVDDPGGDQVLHEFPADPARIQAIHPGSYVHVEQGLDAREPLRALTLECWVRPWRVDRACGILTQWDAPRSCGFALGLDPDAGVVFGLGDGGALRAEFLHTAGALVAGRWQHLLASWDGREKALWIDGREVGRWPFAAAAAAGPAPLRIGAQGEQGLAAGFLDADVALPAVHGRALGADEIAARVRARGLEPARGASVLGCWALDEERGARVADGSAAARHGRIVNHGTWMIGGPSFVADVPRFRSYDPRQDARRGHGLRLAADDLYDCRWEPTHEYALPADARPGFYVARIHSEWNGAPVVAHVSFVVRRARNAPRAPILLLAATNTWRAYGSTPFAAPQPDLRVVADTQGLANSPGDPPAFSLYRAHAAGQGCYQVGLRMPCPLAGPYVRYGGPTDYSHLLRAERFAQIWLEQCGYEFDLASDLDLHREPELLREHALLFVNGHSEYWSQSMYAGVERYLAAGGKLLCLSGNTMYWRVSFDEECSILECRKADAPGPQVPPERRGESWHAQDGQRGGLMNECGLPGWKLIGLASLGWNNHESPAHFSPFVVEEPGHFLFRSPVAVPVVKGDRIGEAPGGALPRANGHEVDVRISTLASILEQPVPSGATHPDEPSGITLLAASKTWPRDALKFDYFMRPVSPTKPIGGELIYWERRGGGQVFNAGSIAAGAALCADVRLQALLVNVLHHFDVPRPA